MVQKVIQFLRLFWRWQRAVVYTLLYRSVRVREGVILYESFYGRGLLDSPYALFNELLKKSECAQYQHVWVLDDLSNHREEIQRFKTAKNVRFVRYNSWRYLYALVSAKYLINNSTFANYFIKKTTQVYVNTWHGIPLKQMGVRENRVTVSNQLRNFLQVDYFLAANRFCHEVFARDYQFGSRFSGKVLEFGSPRIDTLVQTQRDVFLAKLRSVGVKVDSAKQILLYAPTWRGTNFFKPTVDVAAYVDLKAYLESQIDTTKYQILIKPHQVVYQAARRVFGTMDFMVPATIDANELLSVTDVLMSDFSSIFYDFLVTQRPIVFYMPDLDDYAVARGLYQSVEDLPGPVCQTRERLAEVLRYLPEAIQETEACYEQTRIWSSYTISPGQISRAVVNAIFKKQEVSQRSDYSSKKTLLIALDEFRLNGITTSLINLLNGLDYRQYDVTVFSAKRQQSDFSAVLERFPQEARILFREQSLWRTPLEHVRQLIFRVFGLTNWLGRWAYNAMWWREECARYFGYKPFDCAIDFGGYALAFATLILNAPAKRHLIWAHNDMWAEYQTKHPRLKRIFSLYPYFDALVSCSPTLNEVNKQSLHTLSMQFAACKNVICAERVFEGLATSTTEDSVQGMVLLPSSVDDESESPIPLDLVMADGSVVTPTYRLMMIGRLSPEKNYVATIRAFAKLVQQGVVAKLFIVGEGPQETELRRLISTLHIESYVLLVGRMLNPAELMKQCDCFLLTSLYEGQPMVIHEARVAKMPIILSRFNSYRDVYLPNGQILVDSDEESILEGMQTFLAQPLMAYDYDVMHYNQDVYKTFAELVGEGR